MQPDRHVNRSEMYVAVHSDPQSEGATAVCSGSINSKYPSAITMARIHFHITARGILQSYNEEAHARSVTLAKTPGKNK